MSNSIILQNMTLSAKQTIHLLPDRAINQIAAGEVVESPDSVIKELIENSIDAGATSIQCTIQAGGLQLIRISDNGRGMSREDLSLSVKRHATSKISQIDDLLKLSTLGFRGEALASISSVSKFSITSSNGESEGTKLSIDGGKNETITTAARTRGTTIEVRSLFYNVPARKKFQKSPARCKAAVHKLIQTLSLAHPLHKFELYDDGDLIFSSQVVSEEDSLASFSGKIEQIYGSPMIHQMLEVQHKERGYKIEGFISVPSENRQNRSSQFIYINQRPVVSPTISYAVKDAYGTRLPENRFPLFFLHITVPSHLVDVNVHPQKKEVRFQEEMWIKKWIKNSVESLFFQQPTHAFETAKKPVFDFSEGALFEETCDNNVDHPTLFKEECSPQNFVQESFTSYESSSQLFPVGIYNHLILIEGNQLPLHLKIAKESLVLIDLKIASAQLFYENSIKGDKNGSKTIPLLLPITINLTKEEFRLFTLHENAFTQFGFDIRPFGENCVIVEGRPDFMDESLLENNLKDMILSLRNDDDNSHPFAKAATRFHTSAKSRFSLSEAEAIVQKLLKCKSPRIAFSGKQIMIELSDERIEKLFQGK